MPLWLALGLRPGPSTAPSTPSLLDLDALACWAGGFTPRVSQEPPDRLLLEIGACLRLFGGWQRIAGQVAEGLAAQGLSARLALAPTPQAALWLEQAGQGDGMLACTDPAALPSVLDRLPVAALDLPDVARRRLEGFGLRTLAAVRRLPCAELTRRLGPELMGRIARAYGELPDPRPEFVFPLQFTQSIELPAPSERAEALLFAARRLTAALAGWLVQRQSVIAECRLSLIHHQAPATELVLGFASATRSPVRLDRVLRERLERLPLPAPVESLRLEATRIESSPAASAGLFDALDNEVAAQDAMAALVERLQARLGAAQVYRLALVADHRPECATGRVPLTNLALPASRIQTAFQPGHAAMPRPFWLLAHPRPIAAWDGRPSLGGPMKLLAGPERLESGWWDSGLTNPASESATIAATGDLRRDYFIAQTADHRWAWVYRDLHGSGGWYLHGWFA
jgi:protein ImuB